MESCWSSVPCRGGLVYFSDLLVLRRLAMAVTTTCVTSHTSSGNTRDPPHYLLRARSGKTVRLKTHSKLCKPLYANHVQIALSSRSHLSASSLPRSSHLHFLLLPLLSPMQPSWTMPSTSPARQTGCRHLSKTSPPSKTPCTARSARNSTTRP